MPIFKEPLPEDQRQSALDEIKGWKGTPYIWGGNDFSGFDCSGLILEVLQAVGLIKRGLDYTANGIYNLFKDYETNKPKAGCLVFWYIDVLGERRMTHIEMLIDEYFVIGASGGGSKTQTRQDAIKHDAYVKQNILTYRGNNYIIVDPFMDK